MVKKCFYAVARGRTTGIFESWESCRAAVEGFQGNKFQGFATRLQAVRYLHDYDNNSQQHSFTPNKRLCTEPQSAPQTESNDTNNDNTAELSSTHVPTTNCLTVSSSKSSSSTSAVTQDDNNNNGTPTPHSPEVATVAVKSLHHALQDKFDQAHASGQMIELLSPPPQPTIAEPLDDSPQVLAVKSPSQALQEKFDQAQAAGKVIELLSPSRDDGNNNDAPTPATDVKLESGGLPVPDCKMKIEFESTQSSFDKAVNDVLAEKGPGDAMTMLDFLTRKKMRITEVLGFHLNIHIKQADAKDAAANATTIMRRMEGDIPQLGLHKKFFVRGVRVGWPYPVIMPPQRQMVSQVINGLKRGLHVVLESPTGTGKSAALLCSVLAWQRYHAKCSQQAPPKIFYCSRTHSQVAQMVSSLKKTPYRPRMSVLGSRERLCIHREIKPRDGSSPSQFVNANLACRIRVKNTEKYRKKKLAAIMYDDDNPPTDRPSDGRVNGDAETEDDKRPTCPHYRQLTSKRTAALAQAELAPSQATINCCSVGGEKTKLGAVDIEDLVNFGVNPYVRNTAIYRDGSPESTFGITLGGEEGQSGCRIRQLKPSGPASTEGILENGDRILKVNGKTTENLEAEEIVDSCKNSGNPLELQVFKAKGELLRDEHDDYSQHSACPYYVSRALSKHAEIVFCPYNYLLDPVIRDAMGIDLSNSVVVLDEAHNVEDTLRESGSGKFGEFELCELMVMLEYQSRTGASRQSHEGGEALSKVAHELLTFVEKIVKFMRVARVKFEKNAGMSGAKAAILEWEKFHHPDDREFEVEYFGPTGNGVGRKAVGCKPFFDRMRDDGFAENETLLRFAKELENSRNGDDGSEVERRESTLCDRLVELISKLCLAMMSPEHFFISCAARANGSLSFASGAEPAEGENKKPKKIARPHGEVPLCVHPKCIDTTRSKSTVVHGRLCDGSEPKWEAVLSISLLSPHLLLDPISNECRSIVFASGSLAPLGSLCAELGLLAAPDEAYKLNFVPDLADQIMTADPNKECCKLQVKPPPLEANHVVNIEKQFRAVSIGAFPDGLPMTITYQNYKKEGFYAKLGDALAKVVEAVPSGGVLVFLPSYSFLRNCIKSWKPQKRYKAFGVEGSDVWDRFETSKRTIVVEPTGSQADFEAAKEVFTQAIHRDGKALLLAVFRGKMSEGISFNDDFARAVICVGIPFPNAHDRSIKAKKAYNDEMRNLCGKTNLLPGMEWYSQQAFRAIAQALGRCIRHAGDYGAVILMDSRHCDDGAPVEGVCRAHRSLPKWMRSSVRNLSMYGERPVMNNANPPIFNGYRGLADELKTFFVEAKTHSAMVMEKFQKDFEQAKAQEKAGGKQSFNHTNGTWSSSC